MLVSYTLWHWASKISVQTEVIIRVLFLCTGVVPFLEELEMEFKWFTFMAPACKIALSIVLYRGLLGLDCLGKTESQMNLLLKYLHQLLHQGCLRQPWKATEKWLTHPQAITVLAQVCGHGYKINAIKLTSQQMRWQSPSWGVTSLNCFVGGSSEWSIGNFYATLRSLAIAFPDTQFWWPYKLLHLPLVPRLLTITLFIRGRAWVQGCDSCKVMSSNAACTIFILKELVTLCQRHFNNGYFLADMCGGCMMLNPRTNNNRILNSQRYPGDYPTNLECTWKLIAPDKYAIKLTFHDFDIEDSKGCEYDFLDVLLLNKRGETIRFVWCTAHTITVTLRYAHGQWTQPGPLTGQGRAKNTFPGP